MRGALAAIRRERSLAWEAAFLPHVKSPPSHSEFVGGKAVREPASFLDMRLRAATKGLRGISMAEYARSLN